MSPNRGIDIDKSVNQMNKSFFEFLRKRERKRKIKKIFNVNKHSR
jgi:hypothetical protein